MMKWLPIFMLLFLQFKPLEYIFPMLYLCQSRPWILPQTFYHPLVSRYYRPPWNIQVHRQLGRILRHYFRTEGGVDWVVQTTVQRTLIEAKRLYVTRLLNSAHFWKTRNIGPPDQRPLIEAKRSYIPRVLYSAIFCKNAEYRSLGPKDPRNIGYPPD